MRSAKALADTIKQDPEIAKDPSRLDEATKQAIRATPFPSSVYKIGVAFLGVAVVIAFGGAIALAIVHPANEVPDILVTGTGTALGALAGLLAAPVASGNR